MGKAHTGNYLDVESDVVQARWEDCGVWQGLRIEKEIAGSVRSGDFVNLLAHTGNYVEVESESVAARWNDRGDWQRLKIETFGGRGIFSGDRIFLTAHTGKMLDAEDAVSDVQARWHDFGGGWQTFVIEKIGGGLIFPGDRIFLKASTGTFVDVEGTSVRARWTEKGDWQSLIIDEASARRLQEAIQDVKNATASAPAIVMI